MKNRKLIVVAFMLVAAMVIGVGYAAISHSLKVENYINLGFDKTNFQVDFKDAEVTAVISDKNEQDVATYVGDTTVKAAVNETNKSVVDIVAKVGVLQEIGDKIVVKCTIQNNSESYKAHISSTDISVANGLTTLPSTSDINNYVSVEAELASGTDALLGVAANDGSDETTIIVTITLKAIPTEMMEGTFTVSVKADAVAIVETTAP